MFIFLAAACYLATVNNRIPAVDSCDSALGTTIRSCAAYYVSAYNFPEFTMFGCFRYAVAMPFFYTFSLYINFPHRLATTLTCLHFETGYCYRR
jgi:hypothetical protein